MESAGGNIELYGYSRVLGGLLIGGWIDLSWDDPVEPPTVAVRVGAQTVNGYGLVCLYPRDDVKKHGRGILVLLDADPDTAVDPISEVTLTSDSDVFRIFAHTTPILFEEDRLFLHARQALGNAPPNAARARFLKLIERPHYTGVDTLGSVPWPVHLEVDKVYFCPPDGFIIRGWFLDPFNRVARIKVCCGGSARTLDPASWVRVKRRDVIEGFSSRYGLTDDMCGYVAYAPAVYRPGASSYFEVEMVDGSVAYRPLTLSLFTGLPAIKELLGCFDLRRDALVQAYDRVVGPAVEAMNVFRLRHAPEVTAMAFGPEPPAPRCSIIIPLYGRVDFLEYQLAFFSETLARDHEILYVLDDPDRRAETEALAASSYARFDRPFKLLALSHNVGYAPANNVGLRHARGNTICFLNSDVFPRNPDWLESMIGTLNDEPDAGMIGAFLVYEDGTMQHDGCTFERLPEFGNWPFPMHPGKGRRVAKTHRRAQAEIVTGACMVMQADLARELGGFDEGFVIGDFEDADLCLRVTAKGLTCIVDNDAELYHLERQSQNLQASSWRMNLTLFNAWRFQSRWSGREF